MFVPLFDGRALLCAAVGKDVIKHFVQGLTDEAQLG